MKEKPPERQEAQGPLLIFSAHSVWLRVNVH